MNYSEKYFEDEDEIEQFAYEMSSYMFDNLGYYEGDSNNLKKVIKNFLKSNIKPILSEVEKVILENIGEDCISLMRVNGSIYFHTEGKGIFPNLFKFIKEGEEYEIKELLKK